MTTQMTICETSNRLNLLPFKHLQTNVKYSQFSHRCYTFIFKEVTGIDKSLYILCGKMPVYSNIMDVTTLILLPCDIDDINVINCHCGDDRYVYEYVVSSCFVFNVDTFLNMYTRNCYTYERAAKIGILYATYSIVSGVQCTVNYDAFKSKLGDKQRTLNIQGMNLLSQLQASPQFGAILLLSFKYSL
jgi:hypothetical protein